MTDADTLLVHRLIGGEPQAAPEVLARAATSDAPRLLVAAAVLGGGSALLTRAGATATTTRDRQLVAVAGALLDGDRDGFDALVRDHLVDHPDDVLAAWIAGRGATRSGMPPQRSGALRADEDPQRVTRHVVFGTGQVGHPLVEYLVAAAQDVVAVNRGGRGHLDGATVVGGDATDPAFTTEVCAGADVVYFCLNAMSYARWDEEFPPLQEGVLAGAAAAGARLVVLDNLYAYGPTQGRPLVESMPANPTSSKAATRAAMTEELLRAHEAGRVEVAIGRASDYFGPGARRSALGDSVFSAALAGKRAQVMGDIDQPHSYSYTADVAAGLVTLGREPAAAGQIWHLPIPETRTTRQVIARVYSLAGARPRALAAGATTLRLVGLARPEMREYLHTLYQFSDPWVVDDGKFRAAFGDLSTPLDDALASTLRWYRDSATPKS